MNSYANESKPFRKVNMHTDKAKRHIQAKNLLFLFKLVFK